MKKFTVVCLLVAVSAVSAWAASPFVRTQGTVAEGEFAVFSDASGRYIEAGSVNTNIHATRAWVQGQGYLTNYTETDPFWIAVSNTVMSGAAAGATATQPAIMAAHSNAPIAQSGHGPELDPVWSAVSNTVTTGAAAGATALQEEVQGLSQVLAVNANGNRLAITNLASIGTSNVVALGSVTADGNITAVGNLTAYHVIVNSGIKTFMDNTTVIEPETRTLLASDGTTVALNWSDPATIRVPINQTNTGYVAAGGGFVGSGANLTGLNASELTSGTVPLAQLAGVTTNQMDAATVAQIHAGGGASALSDLSDVASLTGATTNHTLIYNGAIWTSRIDTVYFSARMTNDQLNIADSATVRLQMAEQSDQSGVYDAANYQFLCTAEQAGTWFFQASMKWDYLDAGKTAYLVLSNAATNSLAISQLVCPTADSAMVFNLFMVRTMTAGDIVWVRGLHLNGDATPDVSGSGYSAFYGMRLGN